jgi:hypothetical protein
VLRYPPISDLDVNAAAAEFVSIAFELQDLVVHDAVNPDVLAAHVGPALEREPQQLVGLQDEQLDGTRRHYFARRAARAARRATSVMDTMLADRAYLKSVEPAPATRANSTLTPKAATPSFSFDQKKAFVDAATALDQPLSVFDDIAKGNLPLAKIEALKVRRPLLWGEMRQAVARYTVERDTALPYARRILLGTAFSFPADWSMAHLGEIQASMAKAPESPSDPRAAPSKITDDPGASMAPKGF